MPRVTAPKLMPKTRALMGTARIAPPAAKPPKPGQSHRSSHPGRNLGGHLHDRK